MHVLLECPRQVSWIFIPYLQFSWKYVHFSKWILTTHRFFFYLKNFPINIILSIPRQETMLRLFLFNDLQTPRQFWIKGLIFFLYEVDLSLNQFWKFKFVLENCKVFLLCRGHLLEFLELSGVVLMMPVFQFAIVRFL